MNFPSVLSLSLCLLASCSSPADYVPGGGDLRQRASVSLGQRVFSHSSANCIDEQIDVGGEYMLWREDGAFGYDFAIDYHQAEDVLPAFGKTKVEGIQLSSGLRKQFPLSGTAITPYIGAGVTAWGADRDEENSTSRDGFESGLGLYERIGATMTISRTAFIGLDVRFIQEDFNQKGSLNMDGNVVSFVFGWSL